MTEYKEYYVISTKNNEFLSLEQEEHNYISIHEFDEIELASPFDDADSARNTISHLYKEKETIWEYGKYYEKDELRIIKVQLSYDI